MHSVFSYPLPKVHKFSDALHFLKYNRAYAPKICDLAIQKCPLHPHTPFLTFLSYTLDICIPWNTSKEATVHSQFIFIFINIWFAIRRLNKYILYTKGFSKGMQATHSVKWDEMYKWKDDMKHPGYEPRLICAQG